jgi:polar amino acid transport system substrate-binding protein
MRFKKPPKKLPLCAGFLGLLSALATAFSVYAQTPQPTPTTPAIHIDAVVTEAHPPWRTADIPNVWVQINNHVSKILASLNVDPLRKVVPWATAYDILKTQKNVLVYPIVWTPEREKQFQFAGLIGEAPFYFFALHDRAIIIKKLDDAKQYTVCAVRGDARHEYLAAKGFQHFKIAASTQDNVANLLNKKCDVIVSTDIFMAHHLKPLAAAAPRVKRVSGKVMEGKFYMVFNRETDDFTVEAVRAAAEKISPLTLSQNEEPLL